MAARSTARFTAQVDALRAAALRGANRLLGPGADHKGLTAIKRHFHPALGRSARALPRARRFLQGWSRMVLAAARLRLGSQCAEARLSLLLEPIDLRRPTKTGIFDDCVLVDNPAFSWIRDHLRRFHLAGKLDKPLWEFRRANYTRVFGHAVRRLRLSAWGLVPYSLRHSGPSWDRSSPRLSLREIQRRGRWGDPKIVIHYEQSSRTSALLSTLEPNSVRFLRLCEKSLRPFVEGNSVPPSPPTASAGISS